MPLAERAEVAAHLAECAECYEVYAEAVHFQAEERQEGQPAKVVPIGSHRSRRATGDEVAGAWRGRLRQVAYPLAACLTAIFGFVLYRTVRSPAPDLSTLMAQLQGEGALASSRWRPDGNRGNGEAAADPAVLSFQMGALLVDLEVASREDDRDAISDSSGRLLRLFDKTNYVDPADRARLERAEAVLGDRRTAERERRTALATFETLLAQQAPDPDHWALGQWTEAGRLAALGGRERFFADRDNRRYLEKLPAEVRDARPDVRALADQIDAAWAEAATPAGRDRLADLFERILDVYDDPDALGAS